MSAKMRHFSTDPGPEGEHTKLIMINNDYDYFSARNLMEVQYFSRFFLHPGHIHRGAGEQHGGLHLRMYNPWQGRKVPEAFKSDVWDAGNNISVKLKDLMFKSIHKSLQFKLLGVS